MLLPDHVLQKEMDRRAFLAVIGSGLVAVVGISRLLGHLEHAIEKPTASMPVPPPPGPAGYGKSAYGR